MRAFWEQLYGIAGEGAQPNPAKAVIPGVTPPHRLPVFTRDGSILPPATGRKSR